MEEGKREGRGEVDKIIEWGRSIRNTLYFKKANIMCSHY